jgi:hypothetical protein
MESRTFRYVEIVVLTAFGMFAVNTVVVHAGIVASARFIDTVAFWCAGQALVLAAAAGAALRRRDAGQTDPAAALGLLLTVVLTVVGVLSLALRSGDDWGYIIRAAHVSLDPSIVLSVNERGIVPPLEFPHYFNLPYAIEFVSAYVSHLTGLPYLVVHHGWFRSLCAALLPLVWFLALTRFIRDPRMTVIATAIVVAGLFVCGSHINGFGGITLGRIWQNKGILVALLFPAALRYLLDYLEGGSPGAWLKLALLGVVAGGLGMNSFFLWPSYLAILSVAFIGHRWWITRASSVAAGTATAPGRSLLPALPLARVALAACSQAYLIGVFLAYRILGDPRLGTWKYGGVDERFRLERTFSEHLALVFKSPLAPEFLIPFAAVVLMLLFYRDRYRPLLLTWVGALVVGLPLLHSLLVWFSGTPLLSSYWRLSYLAPFPLAAGLAGAAMLRRRAERPGAAATPAAVAAVAAVTAMALALPGSRAVTAPLGAGWPSPSVSREHLAIMAAIDRQSPAGALLATEWISERMPVLYPERPQLMTFMQIGLHYGTWSGNWEVALPRLKAMRYLRELLDADRAAFVQVVEEQRPAAIVFRQDPKLRALACVLSDLGYRAAPLPTAEFALFVRNDAAAAGPAC